MLPIFLFLYMTLQHINTSGMHQISASCPKKGKILKDFPNVTLLRLAIFQTVFWLFGYRLTLNVSQNMVLVPTHLYKITQKLFAALQEPIFLEYFFKVWMSHCYKSFVRKWYKITILIITFLFVNGFQVWDMRWI